MSFSNLLPATVDANDLSLLMKLAASPRSADVGFYASRIPETASPQTASPQTVSLSPSGAGTLEPVIAQQFDQDFFASSGEIINNFIESGQIWALLIGVVLGYLIRGLTSY